MKNLLTTLFLLILITSCDNREKREHALKNLYLKKQQQTDTKISVQSLESELNIKYGELEVAKDNINRTEEFHFLRMQDTREFEIKGAVKVKLQVEKNIEELKTNITILKDSISRLSKSIGTLENFLTE